MSDTFTSFIHHSQALLSTLHGISKMPAMPLPAHVEAGSPASQANWQMFHPDLRGTVLIEAAYTPEAILRRWFDSLDTALGNATNEQRPILTALGQCFGVRQRAMHNPLKALAEIARNPNGVDLRAFEFHLLALKQCAAEVKPDIAADSILRNGEFSKVSGMSEGQVSTKFSGKPNELTLANARRIRESRDKRHKSKVESDDEVEDKFRRTQ